jgi:predicted  nucleic acid-binding Zn-ribbon protein
MLDEVAPEIIWISGFGTFAVMCVMVIVWYISTREVKVKAESPQSTVEVATKTSRRKKQLGSPRNKKPNEKSREVNEHTLPSQEDTEKPENVIETNPPPTQVENIPSKEKEEVVTKSSSAEVPVKKEPERPPPPTVPVVSKKQKHKSRQNAATSSGLSDQNIGQVVTGSTLSEDETQLIMSSLYQEEEWEATNKFDNVKSLKKLNEDLQVRCKDAEKSAQLHSNRIKELGAELKKERNRAAAAENLNQTKLGKLQEENNNLRKLIAQYQAERKLSNGHEPEHQSLHQDNSKLVNDLQSQVAAYEKELQELSGKIKQDQTENVKKIEKLKAMEREKNSIQEKYHKSNDEVHSLRGQIASNKQEIDGLNNSLKKANDLNESCKDDMDKMKLEIKHKVETIQMQEDKFNNQLEELKNQSKHELEGLQVVVSQLQEEKSNLSAALDKLQNANVAAEETQVQQPSEQASCVSVDVQCDFTEESDTSEMKATIDQLKLDNSTLQSKIDSLKTKNTTLRDNCWKALDDLEKAKKEHTEAIGRMENDYKNECIKQETDITENIQREHKAYILSLFPNLLDNNDVFDDWLEYAKDHVTNQQSTIKLSLEEKDAKISELTSELDEKLCLTDDLRNTLSETVC